MLGFTPLSSATLADVGSPSLPVAQISGVEATGEVTNQPIAFQPVTVAISGVSATVAGAGYVDIMIGAYRTLYALNLTAQLEPLPLTGLTRLMLIDSAGELTVENGIAGVPTVAPVAGVESTGAVGLPIASVSIAANLSGVSLTSSTTATTVIVDQNRPINGFGLAFELEDLDNAPHLQSVSGFGLATNTNDLINAPHLQPISGLQALGELEKLANTPIIKVIVGVEADATANQLDNSPAVKPIGGITATLEVNKVDNTPIIHSLLGLQGTIEVNAVDNRPGNATKVGSFEITGDAGDVSSKLSAAVVLSGIDGIGQVGDVIGGGGHTKAIEGVEATQELGTAITLVMAYPIDIGISQGQSLTISCGSVTAVEVEIVPFATPLPDRLVNYAVLTPANSNFAIVDNKINALR
tara:strand:- start:1434 stop:2666 length:1233 start_codon:yes stop_codon:yes gene_type:complete